MSKSKKTKRKAKPAPPATSGQRFPRPVAFVLVLAVAAAACFWWSKGRHTDPVAAQAAAVTTTNQPAPTAGFEKLKGKWRRPDGGYILDIKAVQDSGKLDAAYLNPRPIHVAKAEASQDGSVTKVFVELRDVNYPGSTYSLAYEPESDQLGGVYFQAALGQQFAVVFQRLRSD